MELKFEDGTIVPMLEDVLIVPLWNWNEYIVDVHEKKKWF